MTGLDLRRSPVPMYLQLSTLMRRRISVGEWPQDMRLPALEELMQEFGVARVTVRQALALLEGEGLVTRKQGRGTFVTGSPEERHWLGLATNWDALLRMIEGTRPRLLHLAEGVRLPPVAAAEGRPAPAYRHMKRIHFKDDVPYCVIDIYLDQRIFDQAPERCRSETVLQLLTALPGVEIARAHQTLTIGSADPDVAGQLKIPVNAPTAEVHRFIADSDGCVIYVADIVYRGDFIRLDIDLLGGKSPSTTVKKTTVGRKTKT
ncbi:MAG TPA: GntR family transcriptional regulator [Kiloniellaceae bacterium]